MYVVDIPIVVIVNTIIGYFFFVCPDNIFQIFMFNIFRTISMPVICMEIAAAIR